VATGENLLSGMILRMLRKEWGHEQFRKFDAYAGEPGNRYV
jgi:hypothetical protein